MVNISRDCKSEVNDVNKMELKCVVPNFPQYCLTVFELIAFIDTPSLFARSLAVYRSGLLLCVSILSSSFFCEVFVKIPSF